MLFLATTKSGQELLIRTARLALRPEADEQKSRESYVPEADEQEAREPDAQEDVENGPAEDVEPRGNQERRPIVPRSPGLQT